MGLLDNQTQQQYYDVKKSFTGDGSTKRFTVSNSQDTFPSTYTAENATVYIDNELYLLMPSTGTANYRFIWGSANGWHIIFDAAAPADGATIVVDVSSNFGSYQFTSLDNIIAQFIIAYVGEDKIISKIKRMDVAFHAQRAMQELSFDTFKSCKSQEITVPTSLTMILPHDYVNYIKLAWSDSSGIEHVIYPTSKTSNTPTIKQDSDGNYSFDIDDASVNTPDKDDTTDLISNNNSDTWNNYKSGTPSENQDDYQDDTYWPAEGERYGLDPQHAQANGSFFVDCNTGKIHFSSNMSGKTVVLRYISDGLGTDEEMVVHKFAEEAIYKWIAYGILSTRINTPEYIINRFKKEKFAETRKAKLRLSNIKLEEITQTLRGKSKQIKH
tara:strand:+ start:688 stop:1839 length:1152 start_codon:yes stop_codon:yes gene_type:complete